MRYQHLKRRRDKGMAMVMAIAGIATFLGLIFGWYITSKTNREFSVSERDRKLLAQVAVTSSDSVKSKLVNYLQTLTEAYNPQSPKAIQSVTLAQMGYTAKPSESITVQCIGQGSLNLAQAGASLSSCTDSNAVYPKIFSITVNVASENGGVVASLLETVEVGPASFNDVGYFISGETSTQINFAGGVYEGMVAAFFENPQAYSSIGLINPVGTSLVFNGILMSNLTKDQIYKGVPLANGSRSAVGEIQLNKGFLTLSQPNLGIDIEQFRSSQNFSIVDPPHIQAGVTADKVTVELGGLNESDRCKVRITETYPPPCAPLTEDAIAQHCPNFVSVDAQNVTYDAVTNNPLQAVPTTEDQKNNVIDESAPTTSNVAPTSEETQQQTADCIDGLSKNLGLKVQFNGKYFESWNGTAWEQIDDGTLSKVCSIDLSAVADNPTTSTEDCARAIKENLGTEVGFDKDGKIVACADTSDTGTYPQAMPTTLAANTVYVIRGKEVEFVPVNNSGDFMTVCENATFYIEKSSSVKLMTSLLRTRSGGGLNWQAESFKPTEPKANIAIIASEGNIALTSETRSTDQSKTLATLKAGNTPQSVKSLVIEASLFAPQGSPLMIPQTLRDPSSPGTMGTLEVFGSLMGKNQVLTRSVGYLGNTATVSGFSYVNLVYNRSNLISPAPIMGENISGLALQSTTTSFQLNFANVNEAMAYINAD